MSNPEFPVGDPRNVAGQFPAGDPRNVAGDQRNVAGQFPAGDPRNVAGDPRSNVGGKFPSGDPRNVNPKGPNYDARMDPRSPSFEPALRDNAGLGGVGDRAGADYRNSVSDAEFHARNHNHDGSPYPGRHGGGPNTRLSNPSYDERLDPKSPKFDSAFADKSSDREPRREATEKEKADLEARKTAYTKRTTSP